MNEQSTNGDPPRRCAECSADAVHGAEISYTAKVKHDGKLHSFFIAALPIEKCAECGEEYFTAATDKEISASLRDHLNLLQPDEIRSSIRALRMTQAAFATRLGVAQESVSRWVNGSTIQNRAMDNLMRLFFTFEEVRSMLGQARPDGGLEPTTPGVLHPTERLAYSRLTVDFGREFSPAIRERSKSFQLL